MKKIISIILCAVLAIGVFVFPETALAKADYWTDGLTANPGATFDGGTGTAGDPYIINSETALAQLAVNVNDGITYGEVNTECYFRLDKDLNLSDKLWMPIGIYRSASINNRAFKGTVDGNNKVISNLTVNEPAMRGVGLFGYTIDALIEDLGVQNCDIDGQGVAGGLVGFADVNTSIYNSYTTGSVKITGINFMDTFDGTFAGGLVGIYGDAPSTISGCYSSADVDGDDSIGGLAGAVHNARVVKSYATGNIGSLTSDAYPAGGFVGFCEEATIEQCYATGNVTGTGEAGGFVGDTSLNGAGSTITNCYARGDVSVMFIDSETEESYGWVAGSFAGSVSNITISNCYGTGNVSTGVPEAYHIGGFVGEKDTSWGVVQFNNCFFDRTVTGRDAIGNNDDAGSAPLAGITGLTTANMQGYDTLTNASKMDALDSGMGALASSTAIWYPHSADYPDFKAETCTITYDSQGADTAAVPASQNKNLGDTVGTLPANPTKNNYVFVGWYTAANGGGSPFTASSVVTGSLTVYAKWNPPPTLTSSVSDGKIYRSGRITLTPSIPGGTWSYDKAYLKLSGNTFTGIKAGTTRVTYTVNGQSVSYDITISKTTLPETGQDFMWIWILSGAAVLVFAAGGLYSFKRKRV